MASTAIYVGTPKTWHASLSAANTNRDGSGTIVTLASGGSNGSRIDRVKVVARGATTAGVIRLFLNDGTNTYLYEEIMVDAITPSTSVKVWKGEITFADGIALPNGWSLRASTHIAEAFTAVAHGGDY